MPIYMVTWNLNNERQNYNQARKAFVDHLERYPNIKDQGLESVRFIESQKNATDLYKDLSTKLDKNDRVVVTKLEKPYFDGWIDQTVINWINART